MVRTIVTPEKDNIMLSIPEKYVGVEIEVIVFTKDEGFHTKPEQKKVTFNR